VEHCERGPKNLTNDSSHEQQPQPAPGKEPEAEWVIWEPVVKEGEGDAAAVGGE
jgi:hypothetical protein